jgi:hypothetical protein
LPGLVGGENRGLAAFMLGLRTAPRSSRAVYRP